MRLIFGLACLGINIWLQLMIVSKVDQFIVAGAVHNTQENYMKYHSEVFDKNGHFLPDVWHDWDGPKDMLCGMGLSKVKFTGSIIFLWTIRMLSEVRSCIQLTYDIFSVARTSNTSNSLGTKHGHSNQRHTVAVLDDNNELEGFDVMIIGMPARVYLALFVTLPKLLVGVALLYGGCRWFAATESWEELILNALALEFVISIDELMFEAFTPLRAKETVEKTRLVHVEEDHDANSKSPADKMFRDTLSRLLQLFVCLAWAFLYTTKLQQVIPNFPHDIHEPCVAYLEQKSAMLCTFADDPTECFPYGAE